MALNQRRVKILDLIREDGHAKVQDLSRIFGVTDVTIRQDLEILEKMGYVQREHGGAFLKDVGSFGFGSALHATAHSATVQNKSNNRIFGAFFMCNLFHSVKIFLT